MGRADSLEKTLTLGKTAGKERRGWQRMRWLDGTTNSMDTNLSTLPKITEDKGTRRATVHHVAKSQTGPRDWTATASCEAHHYTAFFLFVPTCLQAWKFSWNFLLNYTGMNLCVRIAFWRTNLKQEATRVLCEMWHNLFNRLNAEPLTFLKICDFIHYILINAGFFPKK